MGAPPAERENILGLSVVAKTLQEGKIQAWLGIYLIPATPERGEARLRPGSERNRRTPLQVIRLWEVKPLGLIHCGWKYEF